MTLKMERDFDGHRTTIRLIGRIQAEHLQELKAEIKDGGPKVKLDLDDVGLVDVEVVRFLAICQSEGIELVRCPPYVRNWIGSETV
jgi:anti-anti-sigma regulatory factor